MEHVDSNKIKNFEVDDGEVSLVGSELILVPLYVGSTSSLEK